MFGDIIKVTSSDLDDIYNRLIRLEYKVLTKPILEKLILELQELDKKHHYRISSVSGGHIEQCYPVSEVHFQYLNEELAKQLITELKLTEYEKCKIKCKSTKRRK